MTHTTQIRVVLEKGDNIRRVWYHQYRSAAARRAEALCELHNCDLTSTGGEYIVHAENFYTKLRRSRNQISG